MIHFLLGVCLTLFIGGILAQAYFRRWMSAQQGIIDDNTFIWESVCDCLKDQRDTMKDYAYGKIGKEECVERWYAAQATKNQKLDDRQRELEEALKKYEP